MALRELIRPDTGSMTQINAQSATRFVLVAPKAQNMATMTICLTNVVVAPSDSDPMNDAAMARPVKTAVAEAHLSWDEWTVTEKRQANHQTYRQ